MTVKKIPFNSALCVALVCIIGCHTNTEPSSSPSVHQQDNMAERQNEAATDTTKKDGPYLLRYPNGTVHLKGMYKNGRRIGEWQSFYPDGLLWSDDYFTDGILDGKATSYYDSSGNKRYEGDYIHGKPSGTWYYWKKNGTLIRSVDMSKQPANRPL